MASSKPSSRSPPSAILEFSEEQKLLREEVNRLESQNSGLASKLGAGSSRLGELAAELEQVRNEDRAASGEQVALETRYSLLKGLQESMEGVDGGVQLLLEKSRDRIQTLLADALQVPEDALVVAEKCLGRYLQALVARDEAGGQELLAALRQAGKGEALIFSAVRRGRFQAHPPRPFRFRRLPGLAHRPGRAAPASWMPCWSWPWDITPCSTAWKAPASALMRRRRERPGHLDGGPHRRDGPCLRPGPGRRPEKRPGGPAPAQGPARADRQAARRGEAPCARRFPIGSGPWTPSGRPWKPSSRRWAASRSRASAATRSRRPSWPTWRPPWARWTRTRPRPASSWRPCASSSPRPSGSWRRCRNSLEEGEESRKVLENRFHSALEDVHQAEGERARFEEKVRDLDKTRAQLDSQTKGLKAAPGIPGPQRAGANRPGGQERPPEGGMGGPGGPDPGEAGRPGRSNPGPARADGRGGEGPRRGQGDLRLQGGPPGRDAPARPQPERRAARHRRRATTTAPSRWSRPAPPWPTSASACSSSTRWTCPTP